MGLVSVAVALVAATLVPLQPKLSAVGRLGAWRVVFEAQVACGWQEVDEPIGGEALPRS